MFWSTIRMHLNEPKLFVSIFPEITKKKPQDLCLFSIVNTFPKIPNLHPQLWHTEKETTFLKMKNKWYSTCLAPPNMLHSINVHDIKDWYPLRYCPICAKFSNLKILNFENWNLTSPNRYLNKTNSLLVNYPWPKEIQMTQKIQTRTLSSTRKCCPHVCDPWCLWFVPVKTWPTSSNYPKPRLFAAFQS